MVWIGVVATLTLVVGLAVAPASLDAAVVGTVAVAAAAVVVVKSLRQPSVARTHHPLYYCP